MQGLSDFELTSKQRRSLFLWVQKQPHCHSSACESAGLRCSPGSVTDLLCDFEQVTGSLFSLLIDIYYSAIKKNEIMPFTATWMSLEIIILSEISQTEKDKYHMILLL